MWLCMKFAQKERGRHSKLSNVTITYVVIVKWHTLFLNLHVKILPGVKNNNLIQDDQLHEGQKDNK